LVPGAGRIFSSEIIKSVSSLSGNLLNDLHYYVNRNLLVKPLSSTWITGTSVFIIICSLEIVQLVTNLAMITAVRVFRMPFILLQKKINMLFTCHVLKNVVRVIEGKIIYKITRRENENWFEVARGSSYRG